MTQAVLTKEDRISRLRRKYHDDVPRISVERAKFFTESWKQTAGAGMSQAMRVALAMKNVYEKMTHYIDPDDRIAGYWTESFLGMPIDIERGVFNKVLEAELNRNSMLKFHIKSFGETFSYLFRKRMVSDFVKNIRSTRAAGPTPMNLGLQTMMEREINRFSITEADRNLLLENLLPWWRGKTVIDVLEKEIFSSGLIKGEMKDFARALPANTSRQTMMVSICSTISTYQAHVIVNYEKVVEKGLAAVRQEIEDALAKGNRTDEELDYLRTLATAVDGIIIYARRLCEALEKAAGAETDPVQKSVYNSMLEDCRRAPLYPAETFRQAVQSCWTLKTALELAHPVNLHCFGRMDLLLDPFFRKDLAEGRISRDEARDVLGEFLLKTMSQNIRPESNILSNFYHRYLGSAPITVGGVRPDGTDGTNDVTYLFIEAAEASRAVTNLSVRVSKDTPDDLLLKIAESLNAGSSNISIFNDDVNVQAMEKRGFEKRDARNYAVMGCVEMLSPGNTGGMSASALLLSRVMDMTMRNGDSQTLMGKIRNVGLRTGDPDTFTTYEQFQEAFLTQARNQIRLIADASNLKDRLFARMLPAPCISAFIDGCLEKGKDVTEGGAKYDLSGISFINSIANACDSLYAIKKLIFEKSEFTFRELLQAIDRNFKGFEGLHGKILSLEGKWGNGFPECDTLVREVTTKLFEETYKYTSYRGGVFVPYVISMITHTIDGRVSIATPDGRMAATPFAASCNPYNVEKNGATGALKSIAAIDFKEVLGVAVNMKFHPSAIGKDDATRRKWVSLLRTYFYLGGAQIQPTAASAETMRAAQKNPVEYRDLMVKVGGYSTYFVDLGREIQEEVISRTEHGTSE